MVAALVVVQALPATPAPNWFQKTKFSSKKMMDVTPPCYFLTTSFASVSALPFKKQQFYCCGNYPVLHLPHSEESKHMWHDAHKVKSVTSKNMPVFIWYNLCLCLCCISPGNFYIHMKGKIFPTLEPHCLLNGICSFFILLLSFFQTFLKWCIFFLALQI